jgi:hypothetical protein
MMQCRDKCRTFFAKKDIREIGEIAMSESLPPPKAGPICSCLLTIRFFVDGIVIIVEVNVKNVKLKKFNSY